MRYTEKKALENTMAMLNAHRGADPVVCYRFNKSLLEEARRSILRMLGKRGVESWKSLSFSDRALICTMVVRALLDKKRVTEFLSGERKRLL